MKHSLVSILSLMVLSSISLVNTYAQCSDGGICSVGGHSMGEEDNNQLKISVSYNFGSSGKDDDVRYHSFRVGAIYNVLEITSVQLSLPYNI